MSRAGVAGLQQVQPLGLGRIRAGHERGVDGQVPRQAQTENLEHVFLDGGEPLRHQGQRFVTPRHTSTVTVSVTTSPTSTSSARRAATFSGTR